MIQIQMNTIERKYHERKICQRTDGQRHPATAPSRCPNQRHRRAVSKMDMGWRRRRQPDIRQCRCRRHGRNRAQKPRCRIRIRHKQRHRADDL